MSKHIGAHLLQADGSAQPASKAKPAAKKVVKKAAKKEESEEEAADDSEEESPPPKKVAKKMTKKQGNLLMGIDNCSGAAHSIFRSMFYLVFSLVFEFYQLGFPMEF